jgi:signal transduction histidine kinase
MRLVPKSLFARMVLVLLVGLVLAQAMSLAVHWRERGEFAQRAMGMRSGQRIADIIRLLDTSSPADRARIVGVLNSPPLRISLDAPALPPLSDDDKARIAEPFAAALRRLIGDDRPLVVQVVDAPTWAPVIAGMKGPGYGKMMGGPGIGGAGFGGGPGFGAGPGMHGPGGPPGVAYVVQTRLADGTLITFDSRLPVETMSWPWRLLVSLAVLLAGVLLLTLIAVRWVTRPLKTLAQAAEELGRDINRPPLDEGGPLEVGRAAHAFNTMQRRLAGFIRERTGIFAAMSHDLKTPITRLRLRAELLEDPELRAKFEKDLREMEELVGVSLDFMRGLDNGAAEQPIDVGALIESLQQDAREVGAEVRIEGTALSPFHGNPQALKRCVGNLIDNAVKYGKSGTVLVEDAARELTIRVRDHGPGIPAEELERVFEPFRRLEGSRSRETGGTGLGLSIARNIARAHGGDIVLRNLPDGGLEAELTLPRRQAKSGGLAATNFQ